MSGAAVGASTRPAYRHAFARPDLTSSRSTPYRGCRQPGGAMKRSRVAVGAVAIVAAMAFGGSAGSAMGATGGDWAQQRYSATQNPYNPAETAISAANVTTLHAVWTRQFAAGKAVWAPIVSGGHLYSLITGGVISMNATTGKTRWRIQLAGVSGGGLAAAGGTVYVTTANGVHALDAATGSELWVFALLIGSAARRRERHRVRRYQLDLRTRRCHRSEARSFDTVWGDSTPIASNGIVDARRAATSRRSTRRPAQSYRRARAHSVHGVQEHPFRLFGHVHGLGRDDRRDPVE